MERYEKLQILHFGKCKYFHTEYGTDDVQFAVGGSVRSPTIPQVDLVLAMSADMKISERCRIAASKGNILII